MPECRVTETRTRVRYKETDQMGIAHHANYLVWFELGRTDLCREAGLLYREIEELGLLMVVTEICCTYRVPYRYDDEVLIRTRIGDRTSRSMQFEYELWNGGGTTKHATGHSRHLWLDRRERRPVLPPAEVLAVFEPFFGKGRSDLSIGSDRP